MINLTQIENEINELSKQLNQKQNEYEEAKERNLKEQYGDNFGCDNCAREFSRHCKRCLHIADKAPTKFKRKENIFKKAIKEAKDLDTALTECKTPKFRRFASPPAPNHNNALSKVYVMKLGELDDWVKTKAQIGDVAYYYNHMLDHHYIYCYLKPDDNPFWIMIQPEVLEKYFKTENKGEDTMIGTMNCNYETPCGWCAKWDKKCDKKSGHKKDKDLEDIKSGKGLTSTYVFREPWKSIVP